MSCGSQIFFFAISSPLCCQNATHGCTPDLQATGDLGFVDAGAVKLPDLIGVESRRDWPAQALTSPPRLLEARTNPFAQNLSLELSEDCQQAGHRPTSGCRQIQGFR